MKWEDDGSLSVGRIDDLHLEKDIPKKKKIRLIIAPTATENQINDSNISFNVGPHIPTDSSAPG